MVTDRSPLSRDGGPSGFAPSDNTPVLATIPSAILVMRLAEASDRLPEATLNWWDPAPTARVLPLLI